jgi:tRNA G18 (ribose-2'-O)-methylase SpoU
VTDAADQRLADYVRLRDTSLRKHLESEHGLFIAEGEKVIRRAVEAGHRPRSFLLAERWLAGLTDVLSRWPDVPVYVVTEELAEAVTGFHVHRGALASLHREQRHTVSDLLALDRLVVLEDVVDHTNVGAILRSAAGLGWDGALLSPRAADPLYRRSIKVSMGAVFSLPWARLPSWHEAPALLRDAGFTTVALTLAPDAVDLAELAHSLEPQARVAILLGTEGAGLSARWAEEADLRVRIPMHAGIDSLNVAAAAAVACYSLSKSSSSSSSSASRMRGLTGQSSG